jgi:hypothetical protein
MHTDTTHTVEADRSALNAMAASATLHCLTGCAIGEILGLLIGTALSWSAGGTIALSIALAFFFGYLLSTLPLLQAGLGFVAALSVVFAADTLSIATMEVVDNGVMALVPGAMNAGLVNPVFWLSLMLALLAAFAAAFPVNRYLLTKGKGHMLTMRAGGHGHDGHEGHGGQRSRSLSTNTLAAALVGFLLGGLTVSVAAQLDEESGQVEAASRAS